MKIELSTIEDLQDIMEIIRYAQKHLAKLNIDQWQDGYPDEPQILSDILNKTSFKLLDEDQRLISTFMLTSLGESSYNGIDGEWLSNMNTKYGVIHRIAVAENSGNKGIAKYVITSCEDMLKHQGIYSLRIDTHADNLAMQHILLKLNYSYCGIITLKSGDFRRAYEKLLA